MFALNTSENSIKRFYRAIENQNANKMLDCVPDDFIDDLIEDYDTSKKEIKSALERYLKDDWTANYVYNDYNPGTSIDVILIYNEKVSKFDLDDVAEELEDIGFLVEDEFDPEDMKKAELYHVDFNNNDNRYQIMYTFKYKGKWYCSNALNLVEHAARLYA